MASNSGLCVIAKKCGKYICTTHGNVEMLSQSEARARGLLLDQPSVDGIVCPVSGNFLTRPEHVNELLDELQNGALLSKTGLTSV